MNRFMNLFSFSLNRATILSRLAKATGERGPIMTDREKALQKLYLLRRMNSGETHNDRGAWLPGRSLAEGVK